MAHRIEHWHSKRLIPHESLRRAEDASQFHERRQRMTIDSRIRRLQDRLCPDQGQEQRLWVMKLVGREFALDLDRCEILGDCGFLPIGRFGVMNFMDIPDGLNARELEQYLRRNGAAICGSGRNQEHIGFGRTVRPGDPILAAPAQMIAGERR